MSLPVGSVVEVIVPPKPDIPDPAATDAPTPEDGKAPLQRLMEKLDQFPDNPDAPADLAAQHDHYLYGTPKRP